MAQKIKVIVIDDHPLILKAVVEALQVEPDIQVVGTADHGSELFRLAREKNPDVVILDLGMSGGPFEPVGAVQSFVSTYPHSKVLILTGYDDEVYVRALIDAGAQGYVLKSDDLSMHLPDGIRTVCKGERFYTPAVMEKLLASQGLARLNDQELAVLRLVAQGFTNAGVAESMGVSEKRIRNILSAVYHKLHLRETKGLNVRVKAVNKARQYGLLAEL